MSKSQTIFKLTIITALFLGQISAAKSKNIQNTSNTSQPAGIRGETVLCSNQAAVADLIFKNCQKLNIALPKYYNVKDCLQTIKIGQYANYSVTFDYGEVECMIDLNSAAVQFDKRKPTQQTLEQFKESVNDCRKRISEARVNKWVVNQEEKVVPQLNDLDEPVKDKIEKKLLAGLTGEAVVCSDSDKVAGLFVKVAQKMGLVLRTDYEVLDCQQQFKIGSYAKYLISLKYGEETCDLFMESLPNNFDKRKPTNATKENFKQQISECITRTAINVENLVEEYNQKLKEEIVEIMTHNPSQNEIKNEHIDYQEVVAEEINNRLAKKNLPGFTGEITDCVNPTSVSELFEKNAKKLGNALTTGYTIVECKQAIKLNSYYNYAMILDYDGQECELYLESKQLQFNKRTPTKATEQQFLDLVKTCNDLVATSEDSMSIDNSEIIDLVEFMSKEVEMALALENLFQQINNMQEDEHDQYASEVFEDNEEYTYNVDLEQIINQIYKGQFVDQESFESSELSSSMNSSNFSSSMYDSEYSDIDELNNQPLLGLVGHAQDSDWEVAADAFAKLVVADMLQGKVVYKQNVLKSQTQVFSGVMIAGVYSFDGVVCELKVFSPATGDKKLKIYHDSVTSNNDRTAFVKTLTFSPYSHPNCVDVFGTETSSFLLSQASK